MTRSMLIAALAQRNLHLSPADLDLATRRLLDLFAESLARGERIEVRGFGAFTIRHRSPRVARNPKTGSMVVLGARHAMHFKPSAALRARIAMKPAGETPTWEATDGGSD